MLKHTRLSSMLNEKVEILSLLQNEETNDLAWSKTRNCWAAVDLDLPRNIFSVVGVGTRGAIVTLRAETKFTMSHALRWRGQFLYPTSVTLVPERDRYEVKAALCNPVDCQADMDRENHGICFPGILTEKYVGHDQPDFHSEVTTTYILVTPKSIELRPGSWLVADGQYYLVLTPHLLDPYKNEFEIRRKEDC